MFKTTTEAPTTPETEAPALIGYIEWEGVRYEIDWPFRIDKPLLREDYAVVVANGQELGDFVHPQWHKGKTLSNTEQILLLAAKYIASGDFDGGL